MAKGTPSKGKKNKASSHKVCRRCGRHAYHRQNGICAYCGYGRTTKLRQPAFRNRCHPFNGNKGFYR